MKKVKSISKKVIESVLADYKPGAKLYVRAGKTSMPVRQAMDVELVVEGELLVSEEPELKAEIKKPETKKPERTNP